MKKLLIGCGIVTLLVIALLVGVVVYLGIKINRGVQSAQTSVTRIEKLNTTYTFTEPATPSLDPERLAQWLQIRRDILQHVKSDPAIVAFTSSFTDEQKRQNLSALSVLVMLMDAPGLMDDFSRFLEEVFSKQEMSPKEYQHITRLVLATLKAGHARGDADFIAASDTIDTSIGEIQRALDQNPNNRTQLPQLLHDATNGLVEDIPDQDLNSLRPHLKELLDQGPYILLDVFIAVTSARVGPGGQIDLKVGNQSSSIRVGTGSVEYRQRSGDKAGSNEAEGDAAPGAQPELQGS